MNNSDEKIRKLEKKIEYLEEVCSSFKFLCQEALKPENTNILHTYLKSVSEYIIEDYEYKMGIRKDPPKKLWNEGDHVDDNYYRYSTDTRTDLI